MTRLFQGRPTTRIPATPWLSAAGFVLVLLAGLTGCNNATLRDAQLAFRDGNLAGAEAQINAYVASDGEGGNRVIAYLEQGIIRRALGDYVGSNDSFALVDERLTLIDNTPDVSLSRETIAAVTNLNTLPYRGYHYDRVMLNTYRALNYLELGERDKARVELRRAYERQRLAVAANAERLRKAEEEAHAASQNAKAQRKNSYDAQRARDDERFQQGLDQQYADLDGYQAYADYVNPFTEWMQGVYYLGEAADGSDIEWSRKAFQRVAGMAPRNRYVRDDYAAIESIAAGGPLEPTTYVVFATGTAPIRGEVRIDIPLFIIGGKVDYVGANFPRLIQNPNFVRQLDVQTPAGTYTTQLLCDMDEVIGQEFRNELPIVITKTLIAAGTKATIAYALRKAAENEQGSGSDLAILVRIATTVYQAAVNRADLRTWASLPKQFQVARFRTPMPDPNAVVGSALDPRAGPEDHLPGGHGTIQLFLTGQPTIDVDLLPGEINVVIVRSINPQTPPQISQFSLGKGAPIWQPTTASAAPQP